MIYCFNCISFQAEKQGCSNLKKTAGRSVRSFFRYLRLLRPTANAPAAETAATAAVIAAGSPVLGAAAECAPSSVG
jgi:hypothetical protein